MPQTWFILFLFVLSFIPGTVAGAIPELSPRHRYLWLETELFPVKGGWTVDSQFFSTVGSSYLLAAGTGAPVEDARASFDVDRPGKYTVWARSKNWLTEFTPGRFQVLIDDAPLPRECGTAPVPEWTWEKAGEVDLPAGSHSLALRDLTGAYGRCDAVLITDDPDFIPPADSSGTGRLRRHFLAGDAPPQTVRQYPVVVIGGGVGGVCAAVAAARAGCEVALLQDRPVLGGSASSEIGISPAGAYARGDHPYYLETGIIRELSRARVPYRSWDDTLLDVVRAERGITLYLNTRATKAVVEPAGHIQAVEATDVVTGRSYRFPGTLFLDCTGDGDVAVSAGAEYRQGRESRDELGESLAPPVPDSRTMGTTLMFRSAETDEPVSFQRPDWAHLFPTAADLPHRLIGKETSGFWWISYGGVEGTIARGEEIRDELLRLIYGVWDFVKNRDPKTRELFRRRYLSQVGTVAAKRESRRLMGDYMLTQKDLEERPLFPDRVAYGGWPIDLHPPRGLFDPGLPNFQQPVQPYSIPFRALYSRNIDNLMFAGRHISASHIALGSTRVIRTIAACAQAIGTAAALCLQYGLTPRELGEQKITELQQRLLKNDARIPGLRDLDPGDLARSARVRASSFAETLPCTEKTVLPSGREHPMNFYRAMMFPAPGKKIESVSLLVRSENKKDTRLELGLRKAPAFGEFEISRSLFSLSRKPDIAEASAIVPPGGPRWVTFRLDADVDPDGYYWVYLKSAPGVFWQLTNHGLPWSCRGYRTGDWKYAGVREGVYCMTVDPPLSYRGTTPENVINGLAWPEEMSFNMWVSDPAEPFPQWIELEFDEPVEFNTVLLTFDTGFDLPNSFQPRSPLCVQSYHIQVPDGDGWKTPVSVPDNRQRFRAHTFETVKADRLRILITGTNGDKSARIYEIRVYNN